MNTFRLIALLACTKALLAQDNPEYTLSVSASHCGAVIEGLPGTDYDDGTSGEPYFTTGRQGKNFEVLLTKRNSPPGDEQLGQTWAWSWGVGVEGDLLITDVSTKGTITCIEGTDPGCLGGGSFYNRTELTGPPWGKGPQGEENHGALSNVVIGTEGSYLPGDGTWIIGRLRVTTKFPETIGEQVAGRIVFTIRIGSQENPISPRVLYSGIPISTTEGNPPLLLQSCALTFVTVPEIDAFVRCDTNNDGNVDISDTAWLLSELFKGGPATQCPISRDCNSDGRVNLSDAVYALAYLFVGGPMPPAPFPNCGSDPGTTKDNCPGGSTECP